MDHAKTFTDATGREWHVEITVGTLPRMKSVAGFSLDDIIPKSLSKSANLDAFAELFSSPLRILEIVYAIIKPEADKAGLTFDQFAERFEGEQAVTACEAMGFALLQAIHDFFLHAAPIKSPMRAAMVAHAMKLMTKVSQADAKKADAVLNRIEAKVDQEVTRALTAPLTPDEEKRIDAALDASIEASRKLAGSSPAS